MNRDSSCTLGPVESKLRPEAYAVLKLCGPSAVPIPANLPFIPCHAANLYFMRVCGAGWTFFFFRTAEKKKIAFSP
jgi:hypothetical protein